VAASRTACYYAFASYCNRARPRTEAFLPLDAMRKRGLCCRPVYSVSLSVRLSVTLVHCIQMAEDVTLRCRPGSPTILVSDPQRRYPVPNETPSAGCGGTKYKGWGNFAIFEWNRRVSGKRYEISRWLLWNFNRYSYALYRIVTFQWPWRTPNPVFKVTAYLKSNISNISVLATKLL